jgi:SAM-dependent methyltransferase
MEKEEYDRLRRYEEKYWWHAGRRDLLAALLRRHVERSPSRLGLDIGCGTGSNLNLLEPYGTFFGSEITSELYRDGRPRPARPLFLARGEALPLRDATLGICTFFDVLEHIDDDVGFLREVRRVLAPGGWVLLSVPAYPFLWSEHDVSLHHKRRYVRSTLAQAIRRGGLEIVRMTYGMTTMFPLIAGYRLLTKPFPKKRPPRTSYVSSPGPVNQILSAAIRAEARYLERGNLPFGTSLFCLAQRSAAGEETKSAAARRLAQVKRS